METIYIYKQQNLEGFELIMKLFNELHSKMNDEHKIVYYHEKHSHEFTETSPYTILTKNEKYKSYEISNIFTRGKNKISVVLIDNL